MVAHEILKRIKRGVGAPALVRKKLGDEVERQGLQVTKCITDGFSLGVDLPSHKRRQPDNDAR